MPISESVMNPIGGAAFRRSDRGPAFNIDLMERILDPDKIESAWKKVKANKGAAGIDGITVEDFPAFKVLHGSEIRRELLVGSYVPSPVLRVSIPKEGGGERFLGIPCILDRMIQQAILQVLTPIFDPGFSESSYGFRPHRSCHGAIRKVKEFLKENFHIAVDIDLAKFFDKVQHDVLMERLSRQVGDKQLLRLIRRFLRAGVMIKGDIHPTNMGTSQGGPLSPLMANVLLDDLDKELEQRGHRFARYADDGVPRTVVW